ncbi:MAG: HD domain-containing protein [Desulfobacterales bacterium]|jgi:putative hydrolase of HD superfamily|nr:HD domain-containing protein [Desulfobacterales bacterium]
MKSIADLLFEARMLKNIPRSGFQFLGAGRESVAEHVYSTTFIAYVMAELQPEVDALKLIRLCLLHDLPEARIGDMNSVQKAYVQTDETKAVADATRDLAFGPALAALAGEYRDGRSPEARLAHDADQIALILELKDLIDIGCEPPTTWLPHVLARLRTETGKAIAAAVLATHRDAWWREAATACENGAGPGR